MLIFKSNTTRSPVCKPSSPLMKILYWGFPCFQLVCVYFANMSIFQLCWLPTIKIRSEAINQQRILGAGVSSGVQGLPASRVRRRTAQHGCRSGAWKVWAMRPCRRPGEGDDLRPFLFFFFFFFWVGFYVFLLVLVFLL